jgi:multicomponent Na+:H+ antiporter subunit G
VELDGALTLALVALFQVITAPVLSQLVLQSACRGGMAGWDVLVVDELAGRTNAPRGDGAADPPPGP